MKQLLLIEDDPKIAEIERDYLEANGFSVTHIADGKDGLAHALEKDYALILLDVMLQRLDGFSICRAIRREKETPILMVTARQEEIDILRGLGMGANDYIMKPFNPNELVARVRAHIERYEKLTGRAEAARAICIGALKIEPDTYRVFVAGKEVRLARRAFELLCFLAENPNHVFDRETLFEKVWGCDGRQRDGHGAHQPDSRKNRKRPRAPSLHRDSARGGLSLPQVACKKERNRSQAFALSTSPVTASMRSLYFASPTLQLTR